MAAFPRAASAGYLACRSSSSACVLSRWNARVYGGTDGILASLVTVLSSCPCDTHPFCTRGDTSGCCWAGSRGALASTSCPWPVAWPTFPPGGSLRRSPSGTFLGTGPAAGTTFWWWAWPRTGGSLGWRWWRRHHASCGSFASRSAACCGSWRARPAVAWSTCSHSAYSDPWTAASYGVIRVLLRS